MKTPLETTPCVFDNDSPLSSKNTPFVSKGGLSAEEAGVLDAKAAFSEVKKILRSVQTTRRRQTELSA